MKQVPLHAIHTSLGAKMVPFAGYEMPVRYSSDKEEHMKVRESVGVFDVSHMGEFLVTGSEALALIQSVTSNDASKLTIGQAQYSCLPNDQNGIVDDLIVYRLDEEEYLLVVNASNIQKDWDWIASHNAMGADMKDLSDDTCLLAVQGPKAKDVLQRLTDISLESIPFYHFVKDSMAGIDDVLISATGYTGAGGFELYVDNSQAIDLWKKVFAAGEPENIQPIGLGARDTLRLEMGYCLYGNDITDTTSPIEAGLGWITKFTKSFTNSEALLQEKEAGVNRRLVGLKMVDKGIPRKDYEIVNEAGESLGVVTSGTISPVLNIGVALGYVTTGSHKSGTEVYIKIRNKLAKAEVSRPPFVSQK